jgi:CBS domain-containing membrane protein
VSILDQHQIVNLCQEEEKFQMMTVREIMITEVNQLPPDASLEQARSLMAEKSIRHIPIVDTEDRLIGLVTQRDILAATLSLPSLRETADISGSLLKTRDIMRTNIFKIEADTDLRLAALTMQRHKIGSLLIVNDDRLVGIVTDSDYVGLAINLLEQMEQVEPPELDN